MNISCKFRSELGSILFARGRAKSIYVSMSKFRNPSSECRGTTPTELFSVNLTPFALPPPQGKIFGKVPSSPAIQRKIHIPPLLLRVPHSDVPCSVLFFGGKIRYSDADQYRPTSASIMKSAAPEIRWGKIRLGIAPKNATNHKLGLFLEILVRKDYTDFQWEVTLKVWEEYPAECGRVRAANPPQHWGVSAV